MTDIFSYDEDDYDLAVRCLHDQSDIVDVNNRNIRNEEALHILSVFAETSKDLPAEQINEILSIFLEYSCDYHPKSRMRSVIGIGHLIMNGCLFHLTEIQTNDIIETLILKSEDDAKVFPKYYAFEAIVNLSEIYNLNELQTSRIVDHAINITLHAKSDMIETLFKLLTPVSKQRAMVPMVIDKLIDYLIKFVIGNNEGFKVKSMDILATLISRGMVGSHVKISEIIVCMLNKVHLSDENSRRRIITVLLKIIEQKQVPISKFNHILDVMIIKATDKDNMTRKLALDSISLLCQTSKSVDRNKVYKLCEVVMAGCNDRHDPVRGSAIMAVSWFAYGKLIPDDRLVTLVELVLDKMKTDRNPDNRIKATSAITMIAQNNLVPLIKVVDVIDAMESKLAEDPADKSAQFMANFALTQLMKHRIIPSERSSRIKAILKGKIPSKNSDKSDNNSDDNDHTTSSSSYDASPSMASPDSSSQSSSKRSQPPSRRQSPLANHSRPVNETKLSPNSNRSSSTPVRKGTYDCWSLFPADKELIENAPLISKPEKRTVSPAPAAAAAAAPQSPTKPAQVELKPSLRYPLRTAPITSQSTQPAVIPFSKSSSTNRRSQSVEHRVSVNHAIVDDAHENQPSNQTDSESQQTTSESIDQTNEPIPTPAIVTENILPNKPNRSDSVSSGNMKTITIAIPIVEDDKYDLERKGSNDSKKDTYSPINNSAKSNNSSRFVSPTKKTDIKKKEDVTDRSSSILSSPLHLFGSIRPRSSKQFTQVKTR